MQALFSGQRLEKPELSSQTSQMNFLATWRGGFNFKGRRSEVNDGGTYAVVYWGRGRAFSREWGGVTPFLSCFEP